MRLKLIWALLATILLAGDPSRGQIFYVHLFVEELGFDGAIFTKLHTQKEWEALFADRAEGFIALFGPKLGEEKRALLESEHFQERIAPHLLAFARHYAKDRPATPVCIGDEE